MNDKEQLEVLAGGSEIDVHVITGDSISTTRVKVKKLSLPELQRLAGCLANVEAEVALYLGKPIDWVEKLVPDSGIDVLTEGRRLNEKALSGFFSAQKAAMEMMGINLQKVVSDAAQNALTQSVSPKS